MREIDVLGVTIKDFPLKELLGKACDALNERGVTTLSWLSANVILSVSENYDQRPWVDSLDLMICDQAGILNSGRAAMQLHKDGKSEDFLENYFKHLANNKATISLVCDSVSQLDSFEQWLKKHNDKLNIAGLYIIEKIDDMDDLFNQLNTEMPQVIFTCLPWLIQGELVSNARQFSNASIWLSFLPEMIDNDSNSPETKGTAWFDRFIFGRKVASYKRNSFPSNDRFGKNV